MSWRTIIVSNKCKLSYKNNYLIIRNDDVQMVHLSEINIIVIDTLEVSITTYLISELSKRKIKVIFCDERRNPSSELISYYGAHNTSKRVLMQINWDSSTKNCVWRELVKYKINMQAEILKLCKKENSHILLKYRDEVFDGDKTNREGHAAKIYFHSLFGDGFSRTDENSVNAALDYGYSILLSTFNKEIVSRGYITQLGINHRNEFNFFNLSCDLLEPFRPLVDAVVYNSMDAPFDKAFKYKLINILNFKVKINNQEQYVSNAISIYAKSVLDAMDKKEPSLIEHYEL